MRCGVCRRRSVRSTKWPRYSLKAGVNAAAIKAAFDAAETETALDKACAEAAERGVFGAPTFFVGKDMFFGNDRLDFLREKLARAA